MRFWRSSTAGHEAHVKSGLSGLVKGVTLGVAAVLIFGLGVNIGNGRISFGPNNQQTGLRAQLDYTRVNDVYNALKANNDATPTETQLEDGLKHGLAEA